MSNLQLWQSGKSLELESRETLSDVEIAYHTYGVLNDAKDNVIWICHALTANSDAADWWNGLVGEGKIFNPEKHFIVCANIIGSSYGSTSALTYKKQRKAFPLITTRDMANAHQLLKDYLQLDKIQLCIGGSLGGQQVMEWAINHPAQFENICLIATNAKHSAWGIAFNEAQRMALSLGDKGIETARAIALLSYRNYHAYGITQTDHEQKLDDFKASSYQRYQGEKLAKRFDADCYFTLSKAMDAHNVGRGRHGVANALKRISANAVVISIDSDILFPANEQKELASHIPNATLFSIDSDYGHDGFLIENQQIETIIAQNIPLTKKVQANF